MDLALRWSLDIMEGGKPRIIMIFSSYFIRWDILIKDIIEECECIFNSSENVNKPVDITYRIIQ